MQIDGQMDTIWVLFHANSVSLWLPIVNSGDHAW